MFYFCTLKCSFHFFLFLFAGDTLEFLTLSRTLSWRQHENLMPFFRGECYAFVVGGMQRDTIKVSDDDNVTSFLKMYGSLW